MIDINILPEKYRKKTRKKIDVNLPLILGAALLLFFFAYIFIEAKVKSRRAGIEKLTDKLGALSEKLEAARASVGEIRPLTQRLKVLEEMGDTRILWARVLNDLSDIFPDDLQLDFLQDNKDVLVLKGVVPPGKGDESVTSLIRSMKKKGMTIFPDTFSQISLDSITKERKGDMKRFTIKCIFVQEGKDDA
jgi:Tfp pilus assembly protein PilN